jgi:hypothetical protein
MTAGPSEGRWIDVEEAVPASEARLGLPRDPLLRELSALSRQDRALMWLKKHAIQSRNAIWHWSLRSDFETIPKGVEPIKSGDAWHG